jgi:hypothetical protein
VTWKKGHFALRATVAMSSSEDEPYAPAMFWEDDHSEDHSGYVLVEV